MSRLFNRTFCLGLLRPYAENEETVFICGKTNWEKEDSNQIFRGEVCQKVLKPRNIIQLQYIRNGVNEQHLIDDKFYVLDEKSNVISSYNSLDMEDMRKLLDEIHEKYKHLIIDITLINIRLLGALLAMLPVYKWSHVFCCYTEPEEYLRSKDEPDCNFDLKNQIMGFDEIPNLQTISDSSNECAWIIFMGYEGARLQALQQEAEPGRKYTIPIISIPAMHAEWNNHVINANMNYIETAIKECENFVYVSAVNPFSVYNYLEEQREKKLSNNTRMKISPVGTRLTVLGSILFILRHEKEILLTDNPYQQEENSKSYGKSHAYDLTDYFENTQNARFVIGDQKGRGI